MRACISLMTTFPDPSSVAYLGRRRGGEEIVRRTARSTASHYLNDSNIIFHQPENKSSPLACYRALIESRLFPRGSFKLRRQGGRCDCDSISSRKVNPFTCQHLVSQFPRIARLDNIKTMSKKAGYISFEAKVQNVSPVVKR